MSSQESHSQGRMALIDALKALGSQFIVLHHLAFYGPMSDWTRHLLPNLVEWFSQDARMAVQVFLVVGGFLAARSLAPQGVLRVGHPWQVLQKRYLRTAAPYLVALSLSVLCTELARLGMQHHSLPATVDVWQFVAHGLLLHSLLDVESISAGVWYVAIDFQLFALLLGLLWVARTIGQGVQMSVALVLLAMLASLYGFNLDIRWDVWALYFMGSYGLGAVTYWVSVPRHPSKVGLWLLILALLVLGALWLEFRARIALALGVALLLGGAHHGQWLHRWPQGRIWAYLGQISYAVFLLNFPVALLVNAVFCYWVPGDPWLQTLGVLLAWGLINLSGALFYHKIERPLARQNGTGQWWRVLAFTLAALTYSWV